MSLTTCSKEHCWGASLDNGWCNKHTDERIAQLEAENAKLKEAAREYSYNEHFPSCKINNPNIRRCNCGYSELAALVEEK